MRGLAAMWYPNPRILRFCERVGVNPLFLLGTTPAPHCIGAGVVGGIRPAEGWRDVEDREVVRRIWEHLEPELADLGYELVEAEYGRHGSNNVLRLFIDKEGGITIDDCAEVSRALEPLLDVGDYVVGRYTLEVSSPGIERPLRKPSDFERFQGEPVKVQTLTPVQGRKRFKGTLIGYRDGLILFSDNGSEYAIHIENVKKARLDR